MKTRLLTQDDWQIYRGIRLESLQNSPESLASSYEQELECSEEDWKNKLKESDVFGAFSGNELMAVAGFYRLDRLKTKHHGDLFGMYVTPEYRGKGLASQLVQTVITHARSCVIQLHLGCVTSNTEAIKLYQKHGFEIYGTEPRALKIGDDFFDVHLMALKLDHYI